MACAIRGEPMPVFGDGTQTRSFSYITTVARATAETPVIPAARNRIINVGGDEQMSVLDLAKNVARVFGVHERIRFLPPRKEVQHAHCRHDLARAVFPQVYAEAVDIATGLRLMADYVRSRPLPPSTECPSPIEIADALPPMWRERLRAMGGSS
jgi:nucleoside-diphosphate-sugar epimerase